MIHINGAAGYITGGSELFLQDDKQRSLFAAELEMIEIKLAAG